MHEHSWMATGNLFHELEILLLLALELCQYPCTLKRSISWLYLAMAACGNMTAYELQNNSRKDVARNKNTRDKKPQEESHTLKLQEVTNNF